MRTGGRTMLIEQPSQGAYRDPPTIERGVSIRRVPRLLDQHVPPAVPTEIMLIE